MYKSPNTRKEPFSVCLVKHEELFNPHRQRLSETRGKHATISKKVVSAWFIYDKERVDTKKITILNSE